MIHIGFVGSSESHWSKDSKIKVIQKISEILTQCIIQYGKENITFVSGGCKKGGIDLWSEIIVNSLGIPTKIFPAEIEQWNDYNQEMDGGEGWGRSEIHRRGYMSRNMDVARTSDILFCIDPKGRDGGGGQWTANFARKINKEVHHIVI